MTEERDTKQVLKEATESNDENGQSAEDDLTRPKEWDKTDQNEPLNESESPSSDIVKDSLGNDEDSPDFVDESTLQAMETDLSSEELEAKRLESVECKVEGNRLYSSGSYSLASDSYTAGLRLCPVSSPRDRAVLYANRGQAKKVLGLPDQAIANCSKAVELNPSYLKAIQRRAELYESTDKLDEALKDFQAVLALDPSHAEARRAVLRLPPLIEERNEKMKAEMMDNLKKLGNMCLKPFGLSTNNFKMEQDPSTGSYNVQFVQNNN